MAQHLLDASPAPDPISSRLHKTMQSVYFLQTAGSTKVLCCSIINLMYRPGTGEVQHTIVAGLFEKFPLGALRPGAALLVLLTPFAWPEDLSAAAAAQGTRMPVRRIESHLQAMVLQELH